MSIVKVWSQFGRIRKLRLHDMSKDVSEAAFDLFLRYFDTEEPSHRAASSRVDKARWSETFKLYEDYRKSLSDPNFSCVICCPNDSEEVTDVMGISNMSVRRKYNVSGIDQETDQPKKKEREKICTMCKKLYGNYHYIPMAQNNLSSLYDDRCFFVVPDFRGLGIDSELVKIRRLICEYQGNNTGTKKAAAINGWENVTEGPYEELGKRQLVAFTDAPTREKEIC